MFLDRRDLARGRARECEQPPAELAQEIGIDRAG
jgi:hypothetical protein